MFGGRPNFGISCGCGCAPKNQCCCPSVCGLFDNYPIGTRLKIGTDSSQWIGRFGGIQDCVALLTDARLFSNIGTLVSCKRPVVRIPLNQITFVAQ